MSPFKRVRWLKERSNNGGRGVVRRSGFSALKTASYKHEISRSQSSKFIKSIHNLFYLVSQSNAIMKRKLDEHDIPTAVGTQDLSKKPSKFNTLGLDSRLLQAVAQQDFSAPTLVQSKAIPLVLEGKDVLGMTLVSGA